MEQIFSLIGDVVDKARSFKTDSGLTNFCYNLFVYFNKRCFRTGKWAGFSPLMLSLIHISEPTRLLSISYAVFCLKKKKKKKHKIKRKKKTKKKNTTQKQKNKKK